MDNCSLDGSCNKTPVYLRTGHLAINWEPFTYFFLSDPVRILILTILVSGESRSTVRYFTLLKRIKTENKEHLDLTYELSFCSTTLSNLSIRPIKGKITNLQENATFYRFTAKSLWNPETLRLSCRSYF